jgi:prephenate dehydrogenase
MQPGEFDRITIVGVGLLGGSLGLAIKATSPAAHLVGVGHRESSLAEALAAGVVDSVTLDAAQGARDSSLVILCTSVNRFAPLLEKIAPVLKPSAIVTDVGSTKGQVVRQAERILRGRAAFVGSHPIAGSEQRGVAFARTDLYTDKTCILTPTRRTNANALRQVEAFWQRLGMRTVRLSPLRHDKALAAVSHLPHAAASILVNMQAAGDLDLAGTGFLDVTRVASGDADMWRDIFLSNAPALRRAVQRFGKQLEQLASALEARDAAAIQRLLARGQQRRAVMLERRLRQKQVEG